MVSHPCSAAEPAATGAAMAPAGTRRWALLLGYALLSVAALYPVLSVDVPALVDYPNHLARAHILGTISDNPILQERYVADWKLAPNLAIDALVAPLTSLASAYGAGRLFVAVTLLLFVGGTLTLHRVLHGRVGWWPAAVYLLVYNHVLAWGFANYLFAVGIYLFVLAGWIASERWPVWARLAVFSVGASLIFFSHLFAFGAYGLTIAAYELGKSLARGERSLVRIVRDQIVPLAQFVAPGVIWLISSAATGVVLGSSAVIGFGSWQSKINVLMAPVNLYGNTIDQVIFGFVVVVFLYLWLSRSLRIVPALRLPLAILLWLAAIMPNVLLSVALVEIRLPVLIACLVVAGIRLEEPNRRIVAGIAVAALVLFGARIWTTLEDWKGYDRQFHEFRQAILQIDQGASVLVARSLEASVSTPYSHIASLAVIDRSIFLPTLFTSPQYPLRAAAAYEAIDMPNGRSPTLKDLREGADPSQVERLRRSRLTLGARVPWVNWPDSFDYVVILDLVDRANPLPGLLVPVHEGSFFIIYAVAPKAARQG